MDIYKQRKSPAGRELNKEGGGGGKGKEEGEDREMQHLLQFDWC
jgi:hypothetical protein